MMTEETLIEANKRTASDDKRAAAKTAEAKARKAAAAEAKAAKEEAEAQAETAAAEAESHRLNAIDDVKASYAQALREGTPASAPWGNLTEAEREEVQAAVDAERAEA